MEISEEAFVELYGLARIGGLLQGLVHNLNAPLQNLGMDMDMILLSLQDRRGEGPELIQELKKRLSRMEEEFNKLNRLIRLTATRAEPEEDAPAGLTLGDFLEEELEFLRANLYFKHNVSTSLEVRDPLPRVTALPRGAQAALGGFLHALVEELEKGRKEELSLEIKAGPGPVLELGVKADAGPLSEGFVSAIERSATPVQGPPPPEKTNMAAIHAGLLLKAAGITPAADRDAGLQLTIPYQS